MSAHTVRPGRGSRSSVSRWPALVLIPALLIAAALFGRGDDTAAEETVTTLQPDAYGPVVAGDDSLGAFWFCSGGTGAPGGTADHQVIAINTTDTTRAVTITVYGTRNEGGERPDPVTRQTTLTAHQRTQWRLGDFVNATFVSATVEVDGGGVSVEHRVSGQFGADAAPCSSTASPDWSVPAGGTDTTAANAQRREYLVFFNPFPADAVLDVRFSTNSGDRGTPEAFRGFVVPGRGVVAVDLSTADVTLSEEVTAAVVARTGRVVVDRLQFYAEPERTGMSLSPGVPTTSTSWVFPAGQISAARRETLTVANPSDVPAEVDVEIRPEDPELAPEPFALTVPPHRHVTLQLHAEQRMQELVAQSAQFSIIVQSADGTPVAAERVAWVLPGQPAAGVGASTGTALAGTTVVADMAGAQPGSLLTVFNPSSSSVAQIDVRIVANGALTVPAGDAEIEIQPGRRVSIPVESLATGDYAVLLRSTVPITAERDVVLVADRFLAGTTVDAPSAQIIDLSLFDEFAE